eukprot:6210377-Pyramimonas_sp.AAC.1
MMDPTTTTTTSSRTHVICKRLTVHCPPLAGSVHARRDIRDICKRRAGGTDSELVLRPNNNHPPSRIDDPKTFFALYECALGLDAEELLKIDD